MERVRVLKWKAPRPVNISAEPGFCAGARYDENRNTFVLGFVSRESMRNWIDDMLPYMHWFVDFTEGEDEPYFLEGTAFNRDYRYFPGKVEIDDDGVYHARNEYGRWSGPGPDDFEDLTNPDDALVAEVRSIREGFFMSVYGRAYDISSGDSLFSDDTVKVAIDFAPHDFATLFSFTNMDFETMKADSNREVTDSFMSEIEKVIDMGKDDAE